MSGAKEKGRANNPPRVLDIDLETFSSTPLPECGVHKYTEDPDFDILLFGYSLNGGPVECIDFTAGETLPLEILEALYDPSVEKRAFNAAFERTCLTRYYGVYCRPEQWSCDMVLSATCGLPLHLAQVGDALQLSEDKAKMKEGKDLIKKFCLPCKPTKANGGRTRNLPSDYPEDWEVFKAYNIRDVEVEQTIHKLLRRWEQDATERKFWSLDQRINDLGIRIDPVLAKNAVDFGARYKAELTERAVELTGLQNPKSVAQVKAWLLEQEGLTVPSLNKKVVADVVAKLTSSNSKEFMKLRSELSKSSTSKYDAMLVGMCEDEHARGCFQFAGAGRTGRFAGRRIQFQNLPQNHMRDLDQARAIVRSGDYDTMELLYPDITSTLSELIRTALIPEDGHRFIVADFSAIEARVVAWIAGEQWRLQVFEDGGDIYCASASQMFHVPVVKHGENGHLRQKGKVAELACIAEHQLVLTDNGLVPIEDVTTDMKLWDGENWVAHKGLIYKGVKQVIEYEGLTATPDHLVFIEGSHEPVLFRDAARRGAHLQRAEYRGNALRTGQDNQWREALEQKHEPLLCTDSMPKLRSRFVDTLRQPKKRKKQGLPKLLATKSRVSEMVRPKGNRAKAAMRKPGGPRVPQLWGTRHQLRLPLCESGVPVDSRELRHTGKCSTPRHRPDRQLEGVRSGKSALGNACREQRQQAHHGTSQVGALRMALRTQHGGEKTKLGHDSRGGSRRGLAGRSGETKKLAGNTEMVRFARTYDLLNAGPLHRFTVSGVLTHNCGYGGGIGALKAFGADKMGMTEEEMVETIDHWRSSSPKICALWRSLEKAAIKCVVHKTGTISSVGNIMFDYEDGVLWMTLPSGRRIAYWGAQYTETQRHRDRKSLTYMGMNQTTHKWERVETWGGKLTENLVQATARDCLRDSMLALSDAGFDIRGHVHDEVIITEPIGGRTVEEACELMGRELSWAPGLPLRADGYECPYYQKD